MVCSPWRIANLLTGIGFAIGVGACVAVALSHWYVGLGMWLLNRLVDGLDGAAARSVGETLLGGYFDIMADFAIYGGLVVAIGIAEPDARVAALALFLAYYLNGSAFLAWSSLAERDRRVRTIAGESGDGRSLNFPPGLAEGTETIVAMAMVLVFPAHTVVLLWAWTAIVFVSVLQRLRFVAVSLSDDRHGPVNPESDP